MILARQFNDFGVQIFFDIFFSFFIHNYRANIIKLARQTTSARQRVSAASWAYTDSLLHEICLCNSAGCVRPVRVLRPAGVLPGRPGSRGTKPRHLRLRFGSGGGLGTGKERSRAS